MKYLGLWSPGLRNFFEKFVKPSGPTSYILNVATLPQNLIQSTIIMKRKYLKHFRRLFSKNCKIRQKSENIYLPPVWQFQKMLTSNIYDGAYLVVEAYSFTIKWTQSQMSSKILLEMNNCMKPMLVWVIFTKFSQSWVVFAGCGWLWLVVAGFGWFWLVACFIILLLY